jgi:DNA repair protein RecN (Recombination protein N)
VDGIDPALDAIAARLGAARLELDEAAAELRGSLEAGDVEPGRLEAVEERLTALDRLRRKHGGTLEAVLEHAERCASEIERLANAGQLADQLQAQIAAAEGRRAELGRELTAGRRAAARKLSKRVASELADLAMEGARLEVSIDPHPDGFGPQGAEVVELRIATNPGMPVSPLKDAASGGELSRIMLALSGLAGDSERILVFDEIDAGIGGATARAVGERLRAVGEGRQVICITHLAQVASQASTHFRIEKTAAAGESTATVERLTGDELVGEIARMLGGRDDDAAASRHARELLRAA